MSHINLNEIDLSKLRIAKVGRTVKLIYGESKEPLQLVTGKLYSPFGVRVNENKYGNFSNCNIDCSLNQSNSEVSVAYRTSLEALDQRVIELLGESDNLFENDKNKPHQDLFNDIQSYYSPILRENKTYPKLMKIALPRDTKGNFECVIFDENKEKVQLDDNNVEQVLCKGKIFKSIIECKNVWYYNSPAGPKFGTTWNLKQMRFTQNDPSSNQSSSGERVKPDNKMYETNMLLDD